MRDSLTYNERPSIAILLARVTDIASAFGVERGADRLRVGRDRVDLHERRVAAAAAVRARTAIYRPTLGHSVAPLCHNTT